MKPDKFKMSVENNIFYAKRNIVDTIYTEARLEGIGVTYPDTNEIYNGRTVAGLSIDDTNKINNLKHAWQFVLDLIDYPIDLLFIRQLNSEIGKGLVLNAGNLRDMEVKIGGTIWKPDIPAEDDVKEHIFNIMNDDTLSTTEKAIDMMLYIMRSQLFMDGNKRTAQLVANKIMIENGAGIIAIPVERQHEFVNLLIDFYETNNSEYISQFVYDSCIDGFNIKEKNEHSIDLG